MVTYRLTMHHENGKGTEENLEKAFYLFQKTLENGSKNALVINYDEIEEGTIEKIFY